MTLNKRGGLLAIMALAFSLFGSAIESYSEGKATIEYKYDEIGNITEKKVTYDPGEMISTPTTPSGQTNGFPGTPYTYITGGSTSNQGHSVQYQFDWKGDGSDLSSWGSSSQSKTWTVSGPYMVRARARCTLHTSVMSSWSQGLPVTIANETVSTPTTPNGPTNGMPGTPYTYITGGSTSNQGHSVQYQFDWKGDGSDLSSWGSSSQTKTWTVSGTYTVKARARCVTHPSIMSSWSQGLTVTIANETVSTPSTPSGPSNGFRGVSYTYTTGGSTSNQGHSVQYQFDWKGDGTDLSSWGSSSQPKTWNVSGYHTVRARARCATHTSIVSGWSTGLLVTTTLNPGTCSTQQHVRIGDNTYNTIQDAYNHAATDDVIKCRGVRITEPLISFNRNDVLRVTLKGGYDCNFTTYTGNMTFIEGSISTSQGEITIENTVLEQ